MRALLDVRMGPAGYGINGMIEQMDSPSRGGYPVYISIPSDHISRKYRFLPFSSALNSFVLPTYFSISVPRLYVFFYPSNVVLWHLYPLEHRQHCLGSYFPGPPACLAHC